MTYLECFQQTTKKTTQGCSLLHHQSITQNDDDHKLHDVTNVPVYSRLKQEYIIFFLQATLGLFLNLYLKFGAILSKTYKDRTLYPHVYQNVHSNLLQKNFCIQE